MSSASDDRREALRTLSWLIGQFDRLIARGDLLTAQKVLYEVADRLGQKMRAEAGAPPSRRSPAARSDPRSQSPQQSGLYRRGLLGKSTARPSRSKDASEPEIKPAAESSRSAKK